MALLQPSGDSSPPSNTELLKGQHRPPNQSPRRMAPLLLGGMRTAARENCTRPNGPIRIPQQQFSGGQAMSESVLRSQSPVVDVMFHAGWHFALPPPAGDLPDRPGLSASRVLDAAIFPSGADKRCTWPERACALPPGHVHGHLRSLASYALKMTQELQNPRIRECENARMRECAHHRRFLHLFHSNLYPASSL